MLALHATGQHRAPEAKMNTVSDKNRMAVRTPKPPGGYPWVTDKDKLWQARKEHLESIRSKSDAVVLDEIRVGKRKERSGDDELALSRSPKVARPAAPLTAIQSRFNEARSNGMIHLILASHVKADGSPQSSSRKRFRLSLPSLPIIINHILFTTMVATPRNMLKAQHHHSSSP